MIALLRFLLVMAVLARGLHAEAPDLQEILRKFLEKSEDPECVSRRNGIAYQRTSRVEYLEEDGTVKRNTVRVYEIAPKNGFPVTRLVTVNGMPATERDDKNRSAARETGDKSRTLALSRDLLSRYDFRFVREEEFASRPSWVLSFAPKKDAPSENFFDRLVNAMTGTLWIDQEDYQLAKADLALSKRVSFFGGIAGAIDKLDLTLIQRRIDPSIWLGEAIHIDFSGRKLLSTMRFRCFENCADFRSEPSEHASVR